MAEILLSLTIIGVVAAITLPSLTGNINERTWNTQRKALYARMSQAIALLPTLGGYGTYNGTYSDGSVTVTQDTAAMAFVTELSKVLKINNICDSEKLSDCGLDKYTTLGSNPVTLTFPKTLSELNSDFNKVTGYGSGHSQKHINTKAAAFETTNGESIAVYYNPRCVDTQAAYNASGYTWVFPFMCANFVYDLNGKKGPNTVGKDIGFMSVMYPNNPVLAAPVPTNGIWETGNWNTVKNKCSAQSRESRLPNLEEAQAIYYNKQFMNVNSSRRPEMWSSTMSAPGSVYFIWLEWGARDSMSVNYANDAVGAYCVKR